MNLENLTNEGLVEFAQQNGDGHSAFGILYTRLRGKLLRTFRSWNINLQDSEDMIQETFVKAYSSFNNYDSSRSKFSAWVYHIAFNVLRDNHRNYTNRMALIPEEYGIELDELPGTVENPEELMLKWEESDKIKKHIQSLPEKYKEVLFERVYGEKTYREISERIELPLETVKSRIYRGMDLLKRKFL